MRRTRVGGAVCSHVAMGCLLTTCYCMVTAVAVVAEERIVLLEPEQAIWVRGFTASEPATMQDVLAADKANGWKRVTYDAASDTYDVKAALWVGYTARWDPTFLQIGSRAHPRETVVVHGNVWIRPPRETLSLDEEPRGIRNCLTLGVRDDGEVRPCLKIACEEAEQYGLLIGHRQGPDFRWRGGSLRLFRGTVTAATPDAEHRVRGSAWWQGLHAGWYATSVELLEARVAWVSGCVAYGIGAGNSTLRGCTFEHCGTVLMQGHQEFTDCTFKHLEGSGAASASSLRFVRCVFEQNQHNWMLQNHRGSFVELINCDVGEPREALLLRKNRADAKQLLREGIPMYPYCVERRSCLVEVVDGAGAPIDGAVVSVEGPDDPYADRPELALVRGKVAITDAAGRTPARFEHGALLPAVRRLQATDDPEQPRSEKPAYRVVIYADGFRDVSRPLGVDQLGVVQRVRLETGNSKIPE